METHYQKAYYNDLPGFRLHHTAGPDAAGSTTGYLHLNVNRMILYFAHGSGNIIVGDSAYRIQAGDVVITDSAELFHCSIDPRIYHERLSVHISPQFWNDFPCDTAPLFRIFTNRDKGQGNLIPADIAKSSGLIDALEDLFAATQQSAPTRDMLSLSKLIQVLSLLDGINTVDPQPAHRNPLLHRVLRYLNEHCTENISVDMVATQFHITPSYFAHWFKKCTGMSPWNYVILRRLQQANALITKGASAEEACFQVGFDNYANFFRLYKKHTGITPSQFKKRIR